MNLALSSSLPLQLITSFSSSTRTASTVTETITYSSSSTIQPLHDLDLDTGSIKHRPSNNTEEGLSGGIFPNMTNNLTSLSSSSGLAPGQSFSRSASSMNDLLLQTGSSSRSSSSNANSKLSVGHDVRAHISYSLLLELFPERLLDQVCCRRGSERRFIRRCSYCRTHA